MPIDTITPQELAEKLKGPKESRPTLLDVRSEAEHALVALPDSVLIPLAELEQRRDEVKALKGSIVVYCHHGVRSLSGAAFVRGLGLEAVSLAGGIDRYAKDVDGRLARY